MNAKALLTRIIDELYKRATVWYYKPYQCRFQWLSTDNEQPLQYSTVSLILRLPFSKRRHNCWHWNQSVQWPWKVDSDGWTVSWTLTGSNVGQKLEEMPDKDTAGWVSRTWKVLVCPERIHRFGTSGGRQVRENQDTCLQPHFQDNLGNLAPERLNQSGF